MRTLSMVVLAGLAATADAQNPDPKRELAAGIDAFRLGKYEEARGHLEKARSLDRKLGDPHRYLAALAQAESKWPECIMSARDALTVEPMAKDAAETRRLHETCRAAAGRPAFEGPLGDGAALAVTSNVPATVKVRGLVLGGTPIAPRAIAAGRVAIEVAKGGYLSQQIDVEALPGIVTDVEIKLEPGEEAMVVPLARKLGAISLPELQLEGLLIDGRPTKVPPDRKIELAPGIHVIELRAAGKDVWRRRVAVTADYTTPIIPSFVDSHPREQRRLLGLGLAGGGIGFGVLGVIAFYTSRTHAADARDILAAEIKRPIGDTTAPLRTRADFEAARTSANRWATISNLAYTAGLFTGAAGLYFIFKGRAPAEDDVPAFVVAPTPGGVFVARSVAWGRRAW